IGEAFNYLYDQAQLSDVRSRERVSVYSLRPDQDYPVKLLDFDEPKIVAAIGLGAADGLYWDHTRHPNENRPPFRFQPGEPQFRSATVLSAASAARATAMPMHQMSNENSAK